MVSGYEMAWHRAVCVFENASPARNAAWDSVVSAASSSAPTNAPSSAASTRGNACMMPFAALTASVSDTGLWFRFQIAS